MDKKLIVSLCALFIGLTSCGGSGSSGVDSSKFTDELSSDELSTLCDWMLDKQGGAGTETDCGEGESAIVGTKTECAASVAIPHCQVSAVESCIWKPLMATPVVS
jgi:hypothetical protein